MSKNSKYSTMMLASVSVITAIMQLALLPIISRHFDKESIALFGTVNNYAAFFTLLSSLGLFPLIVSLKSEKKSIFLTRFLIIVSLILGGILFTVLLFTFLSEYSLLYAIVFSIVSALTCLFLFFFDLSTHILLRHKNYLMISRNKFYQSLTISFVQLSAAFLHPISILLIFSRCISLFASFFNVFLKRSDFFTFKFLHFFLGFSVLKNNMTLVKYSLPNNIINLLNRSIPYFVLIPFFNSTYWLACYVLINRMLDVPMNVYRSSVSIVALKDFSQSLHNNIRFFNSLSKIVFITFVASIPCFLFLFFYSDSFFSLVFGPDWDGIDSLFMWVLLPFICTLCLSPINQALIVTHLNKLNTIFLISELFIKIFICIYSVSQGYTAYKFLVIFCISGFVIQFFSLFFCFYKLRKY